MEYCCCRSIDSGSGAIFTHKENINFICRINFRLEIGSFTWLVGVNLPRLTPLLHSYG